MAKPFIKQQHLNFQKRYILINLFLKQQQIVFGENAGQEPVMIAGGSISWQRLDCKSDQPMPRVYHSASLCINVTFGGRSIEQQALNDAWGLRKHRDGRWDCVRAPLKQPPIERYQLQDKFNKDVSNKLILLNKFLVSFQNGRGIPSPSNVSPVISSYSLRYSLDVKSINC